MFDPKHHELLRHLHQCMEDEPWLSKTEREIQLNRNRKTRLLFYISSSIEENIEDYETEVMRQAILFYLFFKRLCISIANTLRIIPIDGWRKISIVEALREGAKLCTDLSESSGIEWSILLSKCFIELKTYEVNTRVVTNNVKPIIVEERGKDCWDARYLLDEKHFKDTIEGLYFPHDRIMDEGERRELERRFVRARPPTEHEAMTLLYEVEDGLVRLENHSLEESAQKTYNSILGSLVGRDYIKMKF